MATVVVKQGWSKSKSRSSDSDSENFLRVQLLCLAVIGIQKRRTVSSEAIFYICFISVLVMYLATILFALEHASDIALVCDCLGPTFTAYLGLVKQYQLGARREELWKIIETLERLKKNATAEEKEFIERNNWIDRRLSLTYLSSTLSTGSLLIIVAIALGFYKHIFLDCAEWDFPIFLSFPFDTSHPFVFWIFFIWASVSIYMVAASSVCGDATFGGLASNIVVHFQFLQRRFIDQNFTDNDETLKELIEYHSLLLKLSQDLMTLFSTICFNNLMVASVLLCVLGFQVVMVLGSSLMFIYTIYIFAVVIQNTFFSYYGSLLAHESTEVANAIYCSNWYEASPKTRRVILQCLMRAQLPVNTKAYLIKASLPTLRAIINSAGSYVTLLLTLSNK